MDEVATEALEAGALPEAGKVIELIDIHRIMHDIPHRYPFLLLDRVVDVVLNSSAVGVKNVSVNEIFSSVISPIIRSCQVS